MAARERFHVAVTRGNREQLGGPGLGSENGANGRLGLAGTAGTKVGLPLSRSGIQRQSLRPAKRCLLNRQTHPRTAISRYENLSLCVASHVTRFYHTTTLPHLSLFPAGAWTVPRLSDGNVFFGVGAVCGLTNESSPLPSVAVKKFIA